MSLRIGDRVSGAVRAPRDAEKYWGLLRVDSVNGVDVDRHPDRDLRAVPHRVDDVEVRGLVGANFIQSALLGQGAPPLVFAAAELGVSMRLP